MKYEDIKIGQDVNVTGSGYSPSKYYEQVEGKVVDVADFGVPKPITVEFNNGEVNAFDPQEVELFKDPTVHQIIKNAYNFTFEDNQLPPIGDTSILKDFNDAPLVELSSEEKISRIKDSPIIILSAEPGARKTVFAKQLEETLNKD